MKVRTDQLLKTSEVAKLLNVSEDTLKKWRSCGVGPRWLKLGEKLYSPIRYEPDSVNEFLAQCAAGIAVSRSGAA